MYDLSELAAFVLGLPDLVLRMVLALLAVGGVGAMLIGRWYDRTLRWRDAWKGQPNEDVPGVPDTLEPLLLRAGRAVGRRTTVLVTATSVVGFAALFTLMGSWWVEAHAREVDDPRVAVAVLPLSTAGAGPGSLGGAVADLLVVTLDGTRGLRVLDPEALWRGVASSQRAALPIPEALARAREAGAHHLVTGSVVVLGNRLEAHVDVHSTDETGGTASFRGGAPLDSLGPLVDRLAIGTVRLVWRREALPAVPEIDRVTTADARALKAWLDAKALFRDGVFEAALESASAATTLDSTFALAGLEHYRLETWIRFLNLQSQEGTRAIIERAARHADRLTPRNRMRVEASLALEHTAWERALFLFERILSIDPRDVDALEGLAYVTLVHGWSLGLGPDAMRIAYQRVVDLDPSSLPARASLARMATWRGDFDEARLHAGALSPADTASAYGRGVLAGLRVLEAPGDASAEIGELVRQPMPVVSTALRDLRAVRPDLAEHLLVALQSDELPAFHRRAGEGGLAQLWVATSRVSALDSALADGRLDVLRPILERMELFSALAGTLTRERGLATAEAVGRRLGPAPAGGAAVPAAALDDAWALAAVHATFGDTVEARRWLGSIESVPASARGRGVVAALATDLRARLAARSGDAVATRALAEEALAVWEARPAMPPEWDPLLALRLHLAERYRDTGDAVRAEPLYRGLGMPYNWAGFYTALAYLRTGEIAEERGERDEAHRLYRAAAALWAGGDPEHVGALLGAARRGAARTEG